MKFVDHFFLSVIGPRRSGKSVLIKKLLKENLKNRFKKNNVIIICPTMEFNNDYDDFKEAQKFSIIDNTLVSELIDEQSRLIKTYGKGRTPSVLLILDDCADSNLMSFRGIMDTIAIKGRHMKISCILTSQRLSAVSRTIRLNSDYMIIYSPYNISEVQQFLNEYCMKEYQKNLSNIMIDVFREPYQFIFINNLEKDQTKKILKNFDNVLEINCPHQKEDQKDPKRVFIEMKQQEAD
jgi:hypothetical protein